MEFKYLLEKEDGQESIIHYNDKSQKKSTR